MNKKKKVFGKKKKNRLHLNSINITQRDWIE